MFDLRWTNHFGDGDFDPMRDDWPTTADGAIHYLERSYGRWRDALRDNPQRFTEPAGPAEGPYADQPYATLVLHLTREMCHHGGEIGTMRDLYRAHRVTAGADG